MQEILLLDYEIGDTFYVTNYYLWCFLCFFLQTRISYFRIFLMFDSNYQVNLLLYACSSPSMSFYAEIWLQEVTVLVPIRGPLLRSMTYGSWLFHFHKRHCHYLNLMVCFNRLLSMIAIVAVVFSQFINSSFELSITLSPMVCDIPAFDYLGIPTGSV